MVESPQSFSESKLGESRDIDHLVVTGAPLRSYQQASPHYAYRETSRGSRTLTDELEVRRLICLVLGLSVEDNALTLSENEDNGRAIEFWNNFFAAAICFSNLVNLLITLIASMC